MAGMWTSASSMVVLLALLAGSATAARNYPRKQPNTHQQPRDSHGDASDPICYLSAPYATSGVTVSYTREGHMMLCMDMRTLPVMDRLEAWDLWAMQLVVAGKCHDAVKSVTFDGTAYEPVLTTRSSDNSVLVKISGGHNAPLTPYRYPANHPPTRVCITMAAQCAAPRSLRNSVTYFSEFGPHYCAASELFTTPLPASTDSTYQPSSPAFTDSHAHIPAPSSVSQPTPSPILNVSPTNPSPVPNGPSTTYSPSPATPQQQHHMEPEHASTMHVASSPAHDAQQPDASSSAVASGHDSQQPQDSADRTTYLWFSTY